MRTMIQMGIPTTLLTLALLASGAAGTQTDKPGQAAVPGAGCAADCDLPTLWRSVDAVVFLRIQRTLGTRARNLDGREVLWIESRALAHEVFRWLPGKPQSSLDLLQLRDGTTPMEAPGGAPDKEFVAFLRWSDEAQMFESYLMVPVRDGQVKSPRITVIESGMKLEAFLILLRTMME